MNKKWGAMLAFAPLVSVVLIFLVIGLGLLSAFVYGMTGGSSIESTTVAIWFFCMFYICNDCIHYESSWDYCFLYSRM